MQYALFRSEQAGEVVGEEKLLRTRHVAGFRTQLLKWIGNKQKYANEIISYFPESIGTYYEPFIGAGGVMATLVPRTAIGSDCFGPLVEIWQALRHRPDELKSWYEQRWRQLERSDKLAVYERVKASYNQRPNGADLVFLCRACYGGVVRFRKADGYMSTPVGVHSPVSPQSFSHRVDIWHQRMQGAEFHRMDYEEAMGQARAGDLVYCDPPYSYSQAILYGAQDFSLRNLIKVISSCKDRGVKVALSIDGTKKSGNVYCDIPLPSGLFEHEILVNIGRSMLRRFQMGGQTLEGEVVRDRLLLTY